MDKSSYRKLLKKIIKTNNNFSFDHILKDLNISTGNFYYFLAHEGKGDRTMSIEKLDLLYKTLIDEGVMPTNRAYLESLETGKLVKTLFDKFNLEKANIKKDDMTRWLNAVVELDSNKQ